MESKKCDSGAQLVGHVSPDLESAFLTFCPREFPLFAQVMGVDPAKPTKFIPSGPLRLEDWSEVLKERGLFEKYAPMFEDATINGREHIEPLGFRFVDCGGGTFDQHGREENRRTNRLTSWDLVRRAVGETVMQTQFPYLIPIAEIISENDRSAERVVHDPGRARSGCPNTARTLRSLIQGLNMLFPDEPEVVEETMHLFFLHAVEGAKRLIDEKCGMIGAHQTPEGLQEAIEHGADFSALFHLDYYLDIVEAQLQKVEGIEHPAFQGMQVGDVYDYVDRVAEILRPWKALDGDESPTGAADEMLNGMISVLDAVNKRFDAFHAELGIEPPNWGHERWFRFIREVLGATPIYDMVNQAMVAMEADWAQAQEDYWSADTSVFSTALIERREGQAVGTGKTVTVVVGRSDAERFGVVSRLGNVGRRKPYKDRPRRSPADITIQVRSDGRASVSTRGIRVEHVARVLRELDLRQKGVKVTRRVRNKLGHPGNLRFRNEKGDWVTTLYLPEYRQGTGDAFRTNPYAPPSTLSLAQYKDYTVLALAGYGFLEARDELARRKGNRGSGATAPDHPLGERNPRRRHPTKKRSGGRSSLFTFEG